jgi:hypothetical protein
MANSGPKNPPRPPGAGLDVPYALGDKIPAPEAVERNGESVWALWSEVNQQHEARFADTAPASVMHRPSEDQGWAQTQPASSLHAPPRARPVAAQPLFTLDAAMLVARRNNRVCPRAERWEALHALLPARNTPRGEQRPPAPPTGLAWAKTAPLTASTSNGPSRKGCWRT